MTFHADVAVLELAQKIRFDDFKQPAALATPGTELEGIKMNVTG